MGTKWLVKWLKFWMWVFVGEIVFAFVFAFGLRISATIRNGHRPNETEFKCEARRLFETLGHSKQWPDDMQCEQ